MKVTRSESYTDWVFQGAHAGELAARVGVGLYKGSIYFRHAHDNLNAGDEIVREEFFVELSDGTKYKLGEGASAEKIIITREPMTSGGEVHLEVVGKPEVGVGVSRVTRNVTVSYDDGRVPVLDTDQLNIVLAQLNDSLTESMVDTAEKVKEELREELATNVQDVKAECDNNTSEVKSELAAEIAKLNDSIKDLMSAAKYRAPVARWSIPMSSIQASKGFNLLDSKPEKQYGSELFTYNESTKAVNLKAEAFGTPRVLRIEVALNLSTTSDFDGDIGLVIWDKSPGGDVLARSLMRLDYSQIAGSANNIGFLQMGVHLYVSANASTHAVTKDGVSIHLQNYGNGDITVNPGSMITLSLT